mmetsp:Transcript_77570/g.251002  ORF Transcript_77570/g.251002 Transcript_77570/m.251002 type:complete len:346 (+) Transcript_77570:354-1391(+)
MFSRRHGEGHNERGGERCAGDGEMQRSSTGSQLAARLGSPRRLRSSTRRTCCSMLWASTASSMPSSAPVPGNGGAEELPRTAGTLLRPLGVAPTSSFPKPMSSRATSSSPFWTLTARSGNVAARTTRGEDGADGTVTLLLSRTTLDSVESRGPSTSTTAVASALDLSPDRKLPRTVTSRRRGGSSACGSVAAKPKTTVGAEARPQAGPLQGVGAAAVASARTRPQPGAAVLAVAGGRSERSGLTLRAKFSQCHLQRNRPLDSVVIASLRPGGIVNLSRLAISTVSSSSRGTLRRPPSKPSSQPPFSTACCAGRWSRVLTPGVDRGLRQAPRTHAGSKGSDLGSCG